MNSYKRVMEGNMEPCGTEKRTSGNHRMHRRVVAFDFIRRMLRTSVSFRQAKLVAKLGESLAKSRSFIIFPRSSGVMQRNRLGIYGFVYST